MVGVFTIMIGNHFQALRTAAGSAVASLLLARQKPTTIVSFGAGMQAQSHIEAMICSFNTITKVFIYNRTPERAQQLAQELSEYVTCRSITIIVNRTFRKHDSISFRPVEQIKEAVEQAGITLATIYTFAASEFS